MYLLGILRLYSNTAVVTDAVKIKGESTPHIIWIALTLVYHGLYIYRIIRSSDWHYCFLVGRSRVQISARRQAILTEVFYCFIHFLQASG
jgi:hypothetical protein